MNFPSSIAKLNKVAQRLRQIHRAGPTKPLGDATAEARRRLGGTALLLTRQKHHVTSSSHSLADQQKLLFRAIPIGLSQMERHLVAHDRRERRKRAPLLEQTNTTTDTSTGLPSVPPVRCTPQFIKSIRLLLQLLNFFEDERVVFYNRQVAYLKEKQNRSLERYRDFTEEFRIPLARGTGEERQELKEVKDRLQQEIQLDKEDLALFEQSIVTRPFISARMWRYVLNQPVWETLTHRVATSREETERKEAALQLLSLSGALVRLSLGALNAYVNGQEINRHSPRFVVSLPSRKYRQIKKEKEEAGETAPEVLSDASSDVLFDMLAETSPAPAQGKKGNAAAVTPHKKTKRKVHQLAYIPPRTTDTQNLLLDTIALQSHMFPFLSVTEPFQPIGHATLYCEELLRLFISVQKIASTLLVLQGQGSTPVHPSLHQVLKQMESVLIKASTELKANLFVQISETEKVPSLPPARSARVILDLDSLQLIRPGEKESLVILNCFLLHVFPQIKTQTLSAMRGKAEHTTFGSLYDFTTKAHRGKLRKTHGSRQKTEAYLSGTIIQQTRLQQRMVRAALRQQYADRVVREKNELLGQQLSRYELISLFQILTVYLTVLEEKGAHSEDAFLLPAALHTMEAILLNKYLEEVDQGESEEVLFLMTDLIKLWSALVLLIPVVERREALHRPGSHSNAARQERAIVNFMSGLVLSNVNGILAERVEALSRHQSSSEPLPLHRFSLRQLEQLARCLFEYNMQHPPGANALSNRVSQDSSAIRKQVDAAVSQLGELLLHDRQIKREIQRMPLEQRQSMEFCFSECFRAAEKLDPITKEIIEKLCYAV
ncbi:hypothetical protein AGDE_09110 [Angomonas deanei]|uniref:Uncharacterized protein n=1 Tax=Angomonas deanei TaxID=59799 RepID=A0A7G2C0G0_9TRYP|nr:hypothetical protein AGDE_09110 [Angomonas deanei]CAD2213146.1 hypothetical protein, conserved [Angomonas deanei]|eukprot:EPY31322.1 hypothetical protein AGDE_09110 [Angomonas deanei]